jgi:hypothetical protein
MLTEDGADTDTAAFTVGIVGVAVGGETTALR